MQQILLITQIICIQVALTKSLRSRKFLRVGKTDLWDGQGGPWVVVV